MVALFARAWIEILYPKFCRLIRQVALFARAWIEINLADIDGIMQMVALFARAWIEIKNTTTAQRAGGSRPLCEGVD